MQNQAPREIALWALSLMAVVVFLIAGFSKVAALDPHPANYARWGYPFWSMHVVGATEVVAALFLLYPRVATIGASALGVIMLGAVFTHLTAAEYMMALVPLVLLGIVSVIGYARRQGLLRDFGYPRETYGRQEPVVHHGAQSQ